MDTHISNAHTDQTLASELSDLRALILEAVASLHVAALNNRFFRVNQQLTELYERLRDCSATALSHELALAMATLEDYLDNEAQSLTVQSSLDAEAIASALKQAYHEFQHHDSNATPLKQAVSFRSTPTNFDDAYPIYLLSDNTKDAQILAQQLRADSWQVKLLSFTEDYLDHLSSISPRALLIDLDLAQELTVIKQLKQRLHPASALIVLTGYDDLSTRLNILQAGATACLSKPFEAQQLLAWLDHLAIRPDPKPFRILIIESLAKELAKDSYQNILQHAGMEVRTLSDYREIMAHIIDFKPELLLVDIAATNSGGSKLSAVLCQEEMCSLLPMIFIGRQVQSEKKLARLGLGTRDFIGKPVAIDNLIQLITSRVKHRREISQIITRDQLTGLPLRHEFQSQFEITLDLMLRTHSSLAVAVADIDELKKINRRFGYASGNIVVKNIARRLTTVLRYSDFICRYDNDAFALILPNTGIPGARLALDRVRDDIAQQANQINTYSFNITISIGLASHSFKSTTATEVPLYAAQLIEAAAAACEEAKRRGRNQLFVDHNEKEFTPPSFANDLAYKNAVINT